MKALTEEDAYRFCLATGRPYFGSHLHASQGHPIRQAYMQSLVVREAAKPRNHPLDILEIGSWAGRSAITWASALKRAGVQGHVFCVDPWKRYARADSIQVGDVQSMNREIEAGEILPLFLHNIRSSGNEDIVIPIRGESSVVLPSLGREKFQIVFVDGDHRYDAVLSDIIQCQELVAPDGVLCGDDLELQSFEIDLAEANARKDEDYIQDPKTGQFYHPGVTLAVGQTFNSVSVWEGFWAVRKTPSGWQRVELPNSSVSDIPLHLQPSFVHIFNDLVDYFKRLGLI